VIVSRRRRSPGIQPAAYRVYPQSVRSSLTRRELRLGILLTRRDADLRPWLFPDSSPVRIGSSNRSPSRPRTARVRRPPPQPLGEPATARSTRIPSETAWRPGVEGDLGLAQTGHVRARTVPKGLPDFHMGGHGLNRCVSGQPGKRGLAWNYLQI